MSIRWDEWRGTLDNVPVMWIRHLAAWRGFRFDLHKFIGPDLPGCFHTHPAKAFRLVLWGGYVEELENGAKARWRPGAMGFVQPALSHRIDALINGRCSYSLWIRWPKSADIELRGPGWAR